MGRFQAVLEHPAFKANPFATMFEHLENSITSMHAKAAAKAEEKEIRSMSKVRPACLQLPLPSPPPHSSRHSKSVQKANLCQFQMGA